MIFLFFSEMVTNTLYIQGGMNETHIMSDFWKFDLLRKTWERLPQSWPSYSYSTLTDYPYLTGILQPHFIQKPPNFENGLYYGVILKGTADMSSCCYCYKKGSQETVLIWLLGLYQILIHTESLNTIQTGSSHSAIFGTGKKLH